MTMKTYSPERKAAVITRMPPAHNPPINECSCEEGEPDKNALPLALSGGYFHTTAIQTEGTSS